MIKIDREISIFNEKINYKAVRSSGPGGQHVNKVSTAIILKYNIYNFKYPAWFIKNLKSNISSSQLSKTGDLLIKSKKYKSQHKNKEDTLDKLIYIFKKSCQRREKRLFTNAPKKSKEKRLKDKLIQSTKKKLRKNPKLDD